MACRTATLWVGGGEACVPPSSACSLKLCLSGMCRPHFHIPNSTVSCCNPGCNRLLLLETSTREKDEMSKACKNSPFYMPIEPWVAACHLPERLRHIISWVGVCLANCQQTGQAVQGHTHSTPMETLACVRTLMDTSVCATCGLWPRAL